MAAFGNRQESVAEEDGIGAVHFCPVRATRRVATSEALDVGVAAHVVKGLSDMV